MRPCVATGADTGVRVGADASASTGVLAGAGLRLRARRAGLGAVTVICLHVNDEGRILQPALYVP